MPQRTPNYRAAMTRMRARNQAAVAQAAIDQEPWLMTKVAGFAARHQLDERLLHQRLSERDPLAIAIFAKDPSRQMLHQEVFHRFLKRLQRDGLLHNVAALTTHGPQALVLDSHGNLGRMGADDAVQGSSISLHFQATIPCRGGDLTLFIVHKFTEGSGGAQNNQFQDAQNFMRFGQQNTAPNTVFIQVCDGDHFVQRHPRAQTKLDILIAMSRENKTCAIPSAHLADLCAFFGRMHISTINHEVPRLAMAA